MAKSDPFRGHRAAWAYSWTAQAEHDATAIADTLITYRFDALHQEVYYGAESQGDIDARATGGAWHAPRNLAEIEALRDALGARGLTLVPVVVPRQTKGELALHAAAARACGAVVVDMELGDAYWPASAMGEIGGYARRLRELAGPDVCIGWQPDGRIADAGRAEWGPMAEDVAPVIDAWLPQLYSGWPLYGNDMATVLADAARAQRFATLGPVYPTLWFCDAPQPPVALANQLRSVGIGAGFCAFRFGAMDSAMLRLTTTLSVTDPAPPAPPVPDPVPGQVTLEQVKLGLIDKIVHGQWADAHADLGTILAS